MILFFTSGTFRLGGHTFRTQKETMARLSALGFRGAREHCQTAKRDGATELPPLPPDTEAIAEFLITQTYPVAGHAVLFSEFYSRYIEWLPIAERYKWTKIRTSRALPEYHSSGAMTANVKYVANLSFEPAQPYNYTLRRHGYSLLRDYWTVS